MGEDVPPASDQRPRPSLIAVLGTAGVVPAIAAAYLLLSISDVGWAAAGGLVALFAVGIALAWIPGLQFSGGKGPGLRVARWEIPLLLLIVVLSRLGRHDHMFAVLFACTLAVVVGWLAAAMVRYGVSRDLSADSGTNGKGAAVPGQ